MIRSIFHKKIFIPIITAAIVIGISLTAILALNKPVYSGSNIVVTPPDGRTPRPTPSMDDIYPMPSTGGPVDPTPSGDYNDIHIIDNLTEGMIKVIYSDGTVANIAGDKCNYDKSLDKLSAVLVNSDKNMWNINRHGRQLIGTNVGNAFISDSGEYIYYTLTNSNILSKYDFDNGSEVINNFSDNESIDYFAISPNGKSIACTRGKVTYGIKDGTIGDAKIYNDITKVLAVTDDLSLIYGYNNKNELICIDSENNVQKLTSSSESSNIYFSKTRKNVIYPADNKYYLFDGSETKELCDESSITLMEDEKLIKNIADNVYLFNKSNFDYCYIGNDQRTYMLNSTLNANIIAEYKLNFIEYTSSYYYIKDNYVYYYNQNYYYMMGDVQTMMLKEGYDVIKVVDESTIYYLNSQNKLCYWSGTENEFSTDQLDIDNICIIPYGKSYGNSYSGNTAYLVEKSKGVKIYSETVEIKLIEWTDNTVKMELEQTPAGVILSCTEESEDLQFYTKKLYLLNGSNETLLGTRNIPRQK